MKFSVIIPIYGVERYIAATVRSVLAQTYSDFELILVDDGSLDRSLEICQQFTDSRIRIVRQANRGLSGARNTGIRQAQGEFIALLDGDDQWLPDKLQAHLTHFQQNPEVGVSFDRSAFMDEAGQPTGNYVIAKLNDITVADLFRSNLVGNGSAAVFRRSALDAIATQSDRYGTLETFYYDEDLRRTEDHEILLRIALLTAWQIAGIPQALTLYRVNAQGLSAHLVKQQEAWELALAKIRSYAPTASVQWEQMSRAYQKLYLARNAVRLHLGSDAVQFIQQAVADDPRLWREQPRRVLGLLVTAYLLKWLPSSLYQQVEAWMMKVVGRSQRQHLSPVPTQDMSPMHSDHSSLTIPH
ncbi:MAG: glycosyltransferase [Oculatellaceae cyanobacterium Prado106]|jgi:glycosyltransferase involved in cell wall biosynthesis|nr:glycosyltransferase [Oculatellaceae cyanobacterium Prado106]